VNNPTIPVTVRILDKEYRVACEEGEQDELFASARFLDRRMREIRNSGKVIGTERIAVMAALNLAHELLAKPQAEQTPPAQSADKRLRQMRDRIEVALNESNQLEL
jgi:cell division protein ZapA